jgi:hypothetical protein
MNRTVQTISACYTIVLLVLLQEFMCTVIELKELYILNSCTKFQKIKK